MRPKIIEVSGWICGVIAAAATDYWLFPRALAKLGSKFTAELAGLALGVVVIWVFAETFDRFANWVDTRQEVPLSATVGPRKRKTPAESIPLASRVAIIILSALIAVGMISNGQAFLLLIGGLRK